MDIISVFIHISHFWIFSCFWLPVFMFIGQQWTSFWFKNFFLLLNYFLKITSSKVSICVKGKEHLLSLNVRGHISSNFRWMFPLPPPHPRAVDGCQFYPNFASIRCSCHQKKSCWFNSVKWYLKITLNCLSLFGRMSIFSYLYFLMLITSLCPLFIWTKITHGPLLNLFQSRLNEKECSSVLYLLHGVVAYSKSSLYFKNLPFALQSL